MQKNGKWLKCPCGKDVYWRPSRTRRFCSRNCYKKSLIGGKFSWSEEAKERHRGRNSSKFRGEKIKMQGYWWVWLPDHPKANNGRVRFCVVVAEQYLGRQLSKQELVHHIDGNRLNDKAENLYVFPNKREHVSYHFKIPQLPLTSNLL